MVLGHALRNSLIVVTTIVGLQLGGLISGAVVTEQIFVLPGFGKLTIDAVFTRDYPMIQGVVLVTATAYIVINLLVDLLYSVIDPRVRVGGCSPVSTIELVTVDSAAPGPRPSRSGVGPLRRLLRNPLAMTGLVVVVIAVLAALLAGLSSRRLRPTKPTSPPRCSRRRRSYWFGTDELGRDQLSRVLFGLRVSLLVAVLAIALSLVVGVPLGPGGRLLPHPGPGGVAVRGHPAGVPVPGARGRAGRDPRPVAVHRDRRDRHRRCAGDRPGYPERDTASARAGLRRRARSPTAPATSCCCAGTSCPTR